jgi:hypothetical protein
MLSTWCIHVPRRNAIESFPSSLDSINSGYLMMRRAVFLLLGEYTSAPWVNWWPYINFTLELGKNT